MRKTEKCADAYRAIEALASGVGCDYTADQFAKMVPTLMEIHRQMGDEETLLHLKRHINASDAELWERYEWNPNFTSTSTFCVKSVEEGFQLIESSLFCTDVLSAIAEWNYSGISSKYIAYFDLPETMTGKQFTGTRYKSCRYGLAVFRRPFCDEVERWKEEGKPIPPFIFSSAYPR